MPHQAGISRIAGLLADPAREAMLLALAGGRALPAGELAEAAGISPQSASGHLRKLIDGGIVSVWRQGRFRYFRLASPQVGVALEALSGLTPPGTHRPVPSGLLTARTCFGHLAGHLGVAMLDALLRRGHVSIANDQVALSASGVLWAATLGIATRAGPCGPRQLRPCMDWTERRFHLGGGVACAILRHLLQRAYLQAGTERSLRLTRSGAAWFAGLGVTAPCPPATMALPDAILPSARQA